MLHQIQVRNVMFGSFPKDFVQTKNNTLENWLQIKQRKRKMKNED